MRLKGYWGEYDAPFIHAEVLCENFNIKGSVEFLVDTDSSKTIISEGDRERLGIAYSQLQKSDKKSVGIGGSVEIYFVRDVKLVFVSDDGKIHTEKLSEMFVPKHKPKTKEDEEKIKKIPSLLGRDILNRYTLVINKKKKIIIITDEDGWVK